MPAAYLTTEAATARLARYGVDSAPPAAILEIASDDLDLKGPFLGETIEPVQYREFPRTPSIQDDPVGEVPGRILDWVALRAHQLVEEDDAPILSERVSSIGVGYGGSGKRSQHYRLMKNLLRLYRARGEARVV